MKKSDLAKRLLSRCYHHSASNPSTKHHPRIDPTSISNNISNNSRLRSPGLISFYHSSCTKFNPSTASPRTARLTTVLPPSIFFNPVRRSVSTLPPAGSLPDSIRYILYGMLVLFCTAMTYYFDPWFNRPKEEQKLEHEEHVSNWSNTHEARPKHYYQPESLEDLQRVVRLTHLTSRKIRPVGSGLSPNGLAFSDEGMVNMGLMDKVLEVDTKNRQVTVQAGARIDQVVEALKPHGLTLENYASIKEQQVGGFTQVGAHGSGARIPPVDERVVKLKLVTPERGTMELSAESDPELFYLARCGLGSLGVVSEVTLQCVPSHRLIERTFVSSMKEVRKNHKKWLRENKHLRYMWIPHTETVVVVQSNPLPEDQQPPKDKYKFDYDLRIKRMQELYNETLRKSPRDASRQQGPLPEKADPMAGVWSNTSAGSKGPTGAVHQELLTLPALRDKVLAFDPLDTEHVKRVNKAEADYWKHAEGVRTGWSHEILSFDCGGQQWVSEVCFPCGTIDKPDMKDIKFMEELLQLIKKHNIPAPGPIEQRWTSSSRSSMSPASDSSPDRLFSWVGIIMYLPTEEEAQRTAVTDRFFDYRRAVQKNLWDAYGAYEHWAKVEIRDGEEAEWTRERLKKRFPVERYTRALLELDPKNIFGNEFIDALFPRFRSFETPV